MVPYLEAILSCLRPKWACLLFGLSYSHIFGEFKAEEMKSIKFLYRPVIGFSALAARLACAFTIKLSPPRFDLVSSLFTQLNPRR